MRAPPASLRQPFGEIERRRPADVLRQVIVELLAGIPDRAGLPRSIPSAGGGRPSAFRGRNGRRKDQTALARRERWPRQSRAQVQVPPWQLQRTKDSGQGTMYLSSVQCSVFSVRQDRPADRCRTLHTGRSSILLCSGSMDSTASDLTREELEQRLRGVEPGALLVPTRILRARHQTRPRPERARAAGASSQKLRYRPRCPSGRGHPRRTWR